MVEGLGLRSAIEALERAGLVDVTVDGRRSVIRLSHPLFGEIIRLRVGVLQARRIYASLTDSLLRIGVRRRSDAFRLAVWQLNAGTAHDPDSLIAAAREARARWRFGSRRTPRRGRCPIPVAGSRPAALAAELLMDRGDDETALVALRELVQADGPDLLRARPSPSCSRRISRRASVGSTTGAP